MEPIPVSKLDIIRHVAFVDDRGQPHSRIVETLIDCIGVRTPRPELVADDGDGDEAFHTMVLRLPSSEPDDVVAYVPRIRISGDACDVARLWFADSAVVVVDASKLLQRQHHQSLSRLDATVTQATVSGVHVVVFVDGLEKVLASAAALEAKEGAELLEEAYQVFAAIERRVGVAVETAGGKSKPSVLDGSVLFGSTVEGWAFGVEQFRALYRRKQPEGSESWKSADHLWGDWWYDVGRKAWVKPAPEGRPRGFCEKCLEPLVRARRVLLSCADGEAAASIRCVFGVTLSPCEMELRGDVHVERVMQRAFPLYDAVVGLLSSMCRSSAPGQAARAAMVSPDASKMVLECLPSTQKVLGFASGVVMWQTEDFKRPLLACRILNGTVAVGDTLSISYGSQFKEEVKVMKVVVPSLPLASEAPACPAGHTCLVWCPTLRSDHCLVGGTLVGGKAGRSSLELDLRLPHVRERLPVVSRSIAPHHTADLPKLYDRCPAALRRNVKINVDHTGEITVSGLVDKEVVAAVAAIEAKLGAPLTVGEPVVELRETVTGVSDVMLGKSPNKHNRAYMRAKPIQKELLDDMVAGKVPDPVDYKVRARYLVDTHDWNVDEAKKIWVFQQAPSHSNVFADTTKGVQNLNENKDHAVAAFRWVSQEAPLTESPLHGCRINFVDLTMNADAIHRSAGQIIPASRKAMKAALTSAGLRLMEPIYSVTVRRLVEERDAAKLFGCLVRTRSMMLEDFVSDDRDDERLMTGSESLSDSEEAALPESRGPFVAAHVAVPALEIDAVTELLTAELPHAKLVVTGLHSWQVVDSDPEEDGALANQLMVDRRKLKGLRDYVPEPGDRL